MDIQKLSDILKNEPKFRWKQINKLIFQDLIDDWDQASILPLTLRKLLNEKASLAISADQFISKDGRTIKALLTLSDGLKIETVLMKFKDRNTVCVSSQVGCPLGCSFCATGKLGFKRNLKNMEIVRQVLYFARFLKLKGEKITNIVFMGMGEPFLNYDNVMAAIRILHDPEKFNLGARRISISTAGIYPAIKKFSQEPLEINLAISLHAPNDRLRSKLMPVNKAYPLEKVIREVYFYVEKRRRKVMFEYILIKGVNDQEVHARELTKLLNHPLYHLNLIPYNLTGIYEPSEEEDIRKFKKILLQGNISFTQRYRFGEDIYAACGQLALKKSL